MCVLRVLPTQTYTCMTGEICYSGGSALKHKITLHKTTENSELHSYVCNKTHTKNQCNFQWVVAHL